MKNVFKKTLIKINELFWAVNKHFEINFARKTIFFKIISRFKKS